MINLKEQIAKLVDEFTTPGKSERYVSELTENIIQAVADYIESIELPKVRTTHITDREFANISSETIIIEVVFSDKTQKIAITPQPDIKQAKKLARRAVGEAIENLYKSAKLDEAVKELRNGK